MKKAIIVIASLIPLGACVEPNVSGIGALDGLPARGMACHGYTTADGKQIVRQLASGGQTDFGYCPGEDRAAYGVASRTPTEIGAPVIIGPNGVVVKP